MSDKTRYILICSVVLGAAFIRLLPHAPNVSPIAAMALFAAAHVPDKRLSLVLPLLALFISDAVLGFHEGMLAVYLAVLAIACIGFALRGRVKPLNVVLASLAGSVVFFLITNIPVLAGHMYPFTLAGFAESYTLALPFFRNTLLGDLGWNAVLFGGYALMQQRALRRVEIK